MSINHQMQEQIGRELFDQLIEKVPLPELWSVVVGLLQHILLNESASVRDYHYGMFAMTDTLRDAADRQSKKVRMLS